jgi:hypothetical protein
LFGTGTYIGVFVLYMSWPLVYDWLVTPSTIPLTTTTTFSTILPKMNGVNGVNGNVNDVDPVIRTIFPSFDDVLTSTMLQQSSPLPQRSYVQLRICIATYHFVGPTKNGGIATADTALAEALLAAGHNVTVLYLWGNQVQGQTIEHWQHYYAGRGLTLIPMPTPSLRTSTGSSPSKYVTKSHSTYMWFKAHDGNICPFVVFCYCHLLTTHSFICLIGDFGNFCHPPVANT